jgi:hypothetical protein
MLNLTAVAASSALTIVSAKRDRDFSLAVRANQITAGTGVVNVNASVNANAGVAKQNER